MLLMNSCVWYRESSIVCCDTFVVMSYFLALSAIQKLVCNNYPSTTCEHCPHSWMSGYKYALSSSILPLMVDLFENIVLHLEYDSLKPSLEQRKSGGILND